MKFQNIDDNWYIDIFENGNLSKIDDPIGLKVLNKMEYLIWAKTSKIIFMYSMLMKHNSESSRSITQDWEELFLEDILISRGLTEEDLEEI